MRNVNALTPAAGPIYPSDFAMLQAGAVFALMSGSGSTVYAFFADAVPARALAGEFHAAGYTTSLTPPHFHG